MVKDAEELASSLCRYYEARNREDMDRLPRVTRENVLILKYYSFENYFLDPKIMEKIRVIKSEDDFYEILLKKWNEYLYKVTCSRHLNLTDFEVGASCSIALQGKAKTGYPRVSRGSFFIRLRIFSVLLCTFFIYSFSFFQNIDRRIHIPVHPVSTFA